MEIDVLRPQFLPADMVEHWRALQAANPAWDSPFLSPHWSRAVERSQEGPDPRLRVAVLHEAGRPKGFMAVRAKGFTAMPAGAPMCDYQGLVAEPGVSIDPYKLVQALGVGRFDFSHMLAEQEAFTPFSRGVEPSWVAHLPEGYEAYAAERRASGTSALKDLDKKRRKAEAEHGPLIFTAFSRSRTDFDQLIAWKRAQFQATSQTDIFAVEWTQRLLRDLFASRDPDFGGVLFTLHFGDKLAAAHFHLRGARTIHGWIIAHNAAFERVSPGMLLFQDILRWMDTTPYDRLDFGVGDYRFKRELSNVQVPIGHGFVGVPSPAALLRQAAYELRKAAESLPLGRVSHLPGKAMRRIDILRALR